MGPIDTVGVTCANGTSLGARLEFGGRCTPAPSRSYSARQNLLTDETFSAAYLTQSCDTAVHNFWYVSLQPLLEVLSSHQKCAKLT